MLFTDQYLVRNMRPMTPKWAMIFSFLMQLARTATKPVKLHKHGLLELSKIFSNYFPTLMVMQLALGT